MGFFDRFFRKPEGDSSRPLPKQEPTVTKSDEVPEGIPYELQKVSGKDAVQKALELRAEWRGKFTPVILGAKDFGTLTDIFENSDTSPEEIIQRSAQIEIASQIEKWMRNSCEEEESNPLDYVTNADDWQKQPGPNEIVSVRDFRTSNFHPNVWITSIPTANAFEIPAFLKYGGWNSCPSAEEHVAVWKYWQEKYGAEILCVTGDVVEATVKRPPSQKEDCYALAREQFAYCSDIVTQGVGSIDALAKTVQGAQYWYFWWD